MARYAKFAVSLSSVPSVQVQVNYQTTDGTALANVGYRPKSGTLIFPPGVQTQNVWVKIRDPSITEIDKIFYLDLSSSLGASISQYRGTVHIPADVVTTIALPGATSGTPYSTNLPSLPAGNSYYLSSGTPPPELTMTGAGVISGTPVDLASYSWWVKVSGNLPISYRYLTLTVSGTPLGSDIYVDNSGLAYVDDTGQQYIDGTL